MVIPKDPCLLVLTSSHLIIGSGGSSLDVMMTLHWVEVVMMGDHMMGLSTYLPLAELSDETATPHESWIEASLEP